MPDPLTPQRLAPDDTFDPADFPWDADPAPPSDGEPSDGPPDAPRPRHDAFSEARKCAFLQALVKTGCLTDAARAIGASVRTIYRHQELDPRFLANSLTALRMSATPVELTAWQRAVEGVEQEFACGGQVHVRRRYDGSLLRLLLQGSNPKKYGPRPGFTRKRMLKHERKQIEREIRAKIAAEEPDIEEVREEVLRKVAAIERHEEPAKLAAGWTRTPDGEWVPPGYGPLPGAALPPAETGAAHEEWSGATTEPNRPEPPGHSMCQS